MTSNEKGRITEYTYITLKNNVTTATAEQDVGWQGDIKILNIFMTIRIRTQLQHSSYLTLIETITYASISLEIRIRIWIWVTD